MPPSNLDIRSLLIPVLALLPNQLDLPASARTMLEVVRMAQQVRDEAVDDDSQRDAATPDEVLAVANLLRGRAIALVGGERRLHAEQALRDAFDLSDVVWVEIRAGQSYTLAHDAIARADVAVVLLTIRWASHGMSDIRRYCDQYQKPLVRLPGGYNPAQVACQILNQAARRESVQSLGLVTAGVEGTTIARI